MKGRNIMNEDVREALRHLKKRDPVLYRAALPHAEAIAEGAGRHRRGYRRNELFAALAGSVVSQQLSTKAADTIWERLKAACGGAVTPAAVLRLRMPTLRKAGLSAAKARTLKELSGAIESGALDLARLRTMPEEEAIAALSGIWGIGRWTAEMFLLFALNRKDVFSPGDLGLVRSMETIYGLPKGSKREVYEEIAVAWSPHRSFACRVLWRVRDQKGPVSA